MTDKERLRLHMAQVKAVRMFQAVALLAGFIGATFKGFPAILLGGAAAWFLGQAMPPPDNRLDKFTDR